MFLGADPEPSALVQHPGKLEDAVPEELLLILTVTRQESEASRRLGASSREVVDLVDAKLIDHKMIVLKAALRTN